MVEVHEWKRAEPTVINISESQRKHMDDTVGRTKGPDNTIYQLIHIRSYQTSYGHTSIATEPDVSAVANEPEDSDGQGGHGVLINDERLTPYGSASEDGLLRT